MAVCVATRRLSLPTTEPWRRYTILNQSRQWVLKYEIAMEFERNSPLSLPVAKAQTAKADIPQKDILKEANVERGYA